MASRTADFASSTAAAAKSIAKDACPFYPLGVVFSPLYALVMLELSNLGVPGVHIGGDFRL